MQSTLACLFVNEWGSSIAYQFFSSTASSKGELFGLWPKLTYSSLARKNLIAKNLPPDSGLCTYVNLAHRTVNVHQSYTVGTSVARWSRPKPILVIFLTETGPPSDS
jgi:hypothetical protein